MENFQLVVGNPAKPIKDVRELKSKKDGKSYYSCPYNFKRGMPWEKIGFEQWQKNNH